MEWELRGENIKIGYTRNLMNNPDHKRISGKESVVEWELRGMMNPDHNNIKICYTSKMNTPASLKRPGKGAGGTGD